MRPERARHFLEVTQELEAQPRLDPCSKSSVWSLLPMRSVCKIVTQGPGSPDPSRGAKGVRVERRRNQLTWLWAGRCGHLAGGRGHSAHPHCSHSRRAPGPGRGRCGWLERAPTASSPCLPCGSALPSQHTSSSLCGTRHGLWFSCPFHRHRAAFDHGFA